MTELDRNRPFLMQNSKVLYRAEAKIRRRDARLQASVVMVSITAMADVIYLAPNEEKPDYGDNMRWLEVFASDDGRFFGSGGSCHKNGDWVCYCSLAENDVSLEAALAAA